MRLLSPLALLTLLSAIPVFAVPISGHYRISTGYDNNSQSHSFNLDGIEFVKRERSIGVSPGNAPLAFSAAGPSGVAVPYSIQIPFWNWDYVSDSTHGPTFTEFSSPTVEFNTPSWEGGTVTHRVRNFNDGITGELLSITYIDTVVGATAPISGKFSVTAPSNGVFNRILTPLTTEQGRPGLFSGTFTGTATISGEIYDCRLQPGAGGGCLDDYSNLTITFSGDLIEDTYVPEPATYGSIGAGLGFLCWFRSRTRRA